MLVLWICNKWTIKRGKPSGDANMCVLSNVNRFSTPNDPVGCARFHDAETSTCLGSVHGLRTEAYWSFMSPWCGNKLSQHEVTWKSQLSWSTLCVHCLGMQGKVWRQVLARPCHFIANIVLPLTIHSLFLWFNVFYLLVLLHSLVPDVAFVEAASHYFSGHLFSWCF